MTKALCSIYESHQQTIASLHLTSLATRSACIDTQVATRNGTTE
jgi:hypothetical protein